MRKIYIGIILGILLIGIVTAVALSNSKEVGIDPKDYDKLKSVDSLEVTTTIINCNLETCDKVFIETSGGSKDFYIPEPYWENCTKMSNKEQECLNLVKIYYTNEELEAERDEKVNDLKDRIIKRLDIKEKDKEEKETKVEAGIITYTKGITK